MKIKVITTIIASTVLGVFAYSVIGTGTRVEEIKREAPAAIEERGWEIMRYEGFQYGSFQTHGGKVWYHVRDKFNPGIQYRVFITKWDNELQFWYGAPEVLSRVEIK